MNHWNISSAIVSVLNSTSVVSIASACTGGAQVTEEQSVDQLQKRVRELEGQARGQKKSKSFVERRADQRNSAPKVQMAPIASTSSSAKVQVCYRYNSKKGCPQDAGCAYDHICRKCKKSGHAIMKCPDN